MKKSIKSLIAIAMIAASSGAVSMPGHAALLAPVSPLLGITLTGILAVNAMMCTTCPSSTKTERAIITGFIGLILLDGEGSQEIAFQPLTPNQRHALGITEGQRSNYNSEVSELNQVAGAVSRDLSGMKDPTHADSKALWERYGANLSADTLSVAQKIIEQQTTR